MLSALAEWIKAHVLGLPGAGLIFLMEGFGAPLPIEVPLWIIGSRQLAGINSYWQMVFLMWSTTVVGNMIGYYLGYYGGRPAVLKLMSWFRIKPDFWAKVETWFQRHGLKAVAMTRWTNWGFAQCMWLCGITRVPFGRFFTVMVLNNFVWAMAWVWLARKAVNYLHELTGRLSAGAGLVLLGLLAVGLVVWLVLRRRQARTSAN